MVVHTGVGSRRRCRSHGCRGALTSYSNQRRLIRAVGKLTSREDELELDQFHVREISVGWLVEDSHPHVLHLG